MHGLLGVGEATIVCCMYVVNVLWSTSSPAQKQTSGVQHSQA